MTTDINYLIPLAIIGFVGLLIGLLVGFLVSGLRGASSKSKQRRNRDLIEVVRIWQDRRNSNLSMEIGGKFYKEVGEFSEKSRRGFAALINELQAWSGMTDFVQPPANATLDRPVVTGQKPEQEISSLSEEDQIPESSSSTIELPVTPPTEIEAQLPSSEETYYSMPVGPEGAPTGERRSKLLALEKSQETVEESAEEIKSIATLVDEVLQEKLASSPYKDQTIRLMELPGGGMVVVVNQNQYEGVNEVPDPGIRNLIQESVADWERRLDLG